MFSVHRLRGALFILVGLAALAGWYYYLSQRGPRGVEKKGASLALSPDDRLALVALSKEITRLEALYRRGRGDEPLSQEAIAALQGAGEKERELLRLDPRARAEEAVRLERLESALADLRADETEARINQLKQEGEAAREKQNVGLAVGAFAEALQLQQRVNQSDAAHPKKNLVRESALVREITRAQAEPLKKQVETTLASARAAGAAGRPGEALRAYTEARDLQARLNHEFSDSAFADLNGLDRIEREIVSLKSVDSAESVEKKEKAGDAAAAAENPAEAAGRYLEAEQLQEALNAKFPGSRYLSAERIDLLEGKRQTALSSEGARKLSTLEGEIDASLRAGALNDARLKMTAGHELASKLMADYPRSRALDEALRNKFTFLAMSSGGLSRIHELVVAELDLQNGGGGTKFFKTGVPQELYRLVIGENPSRIKNDARPVDSVSWNDARVFCTRLGWLLGTRVHLPGEDPFKAWIRSFPPQRQGKTEEPSKAESRLEWLETGEEAPVAPLAELTATSSELDPGSISVSHADKTERGRHIGFRVVVETAEPGRLGKD